MGEREHELPAQGEISSGVLATRGEAKLPLYRLDHNKDKVLKGSFTRSLAVVQC